MQERAARRSVIASRTTAPGPFRTPGASGASRGGDHKGLLRGAGQFLQDVLDFDVRHHLATNFAEAAQAVGDAQKTVFIHPRDVPGVVPAVAEDLGGFFRLVEVAAHDVRSADKQQSRLIRAYALNGVWFN